MSDELTTETCIACGVPLKVGDKYLPDLSGGSIHLDCCGDSFCDLETGDPLEVCVVPEPLIWSEP